MLNEAVSHLTIRDTNQETMTPTCLLVMMQHTDMMSKAYAKAAEDHECSTFGLDEVLGSDGQLHGAIAEFDECVHGYAA